MATHTGPISNHLKINDFGSTHIDVVIESSQQVYSLHRISLRNYYTGPQVVKTLLRLRNDSVNRFDVQTWTSRPVLSIAELQPMSLTNYGLEAQRYPIPVVVKDRNVDPYISPRLCSPKTFPSAIDLQQYLSDEYQITGRSRRSPTFSRTIKTIMISYETSKSSVLAFAFIVLIVAILVGVIAGVLSKKSEVGIAVTSGLVAIMAVVQGLYRS